MKRIIEKFKEFQKPIGLLTVAVSASTVSVNLLISLIQALSDGHIDMSETQALLNQAQGLEVPALLVIIFILNKLVKSD